MYTKIDDEYRDKKIVNTIKQLPEKLKNIIEKTSSEYTSIANQLDSRYPQRLLSEKNELKNEEEYKKLLEESETKFNKLREYKLADLQIIKTGEYNNKYATALKIYFDDFSKKYSVFEDLIDKLDLFVHIINDRFRFKRISVSKDCGFEILDDESGEKIDLIDLSSGEQQEIILYYDLIFDTQKDLKLLIDEPEISLHVEWQNRFMDDLIKIIKDTNIQVIIATHAPQIINNYWDNQIDLGELYGKKN